jgi:hypothetical protein
MQDTLVPQPWDPPPLSNKDNIVRFEVSTAVTMKNAVFWDIRTPFVTHRKHITSPLQSSAGYCYVRFEVFTVVIMKNAVFWDIVTCGSYKSHM